MRKGIIILSIGILLLLVYGFIKGNKSVSKEVWMKFRLIKIAYVGSNLKIVSWNIQNFGRSKMSNDSVMVFISEVVKGYDIVAIQEVSVSEFGSQAVAKLDDLLDRSGTSWDYIISDATSGEGSERYAYLFKKDRVKL